jgi:hypothetical protein
MTKEEYLKLTQQELLTIFTTIKAKNADYTGGSGDPFENFKMCERVGLGKAETGILIRMMDKIQRVKSFISKGTLEVKNESAADAVRDIIGYSLVLLGMMKDNETPIKEVK